MDAKFLHTDFKKEIAVDNMSMMVVMHVIDILFIYNVCKVIDYP